MYRIYDSLRCITPCCRRVESQISLSSRNGTSSASRFGNTNSDCPEFSFILTFLANSRNTRFARFLLTAIPKRFPTIMPMRPPFPPVLHTSKLKRAVETRRPCCLTCSISRLVRRKKVLSPLPLGLFRLIERSHPLGARPQDPCAADATPTTHHHPVKGELC